MYCTPLAGNTGRKKSPSRHHRTTLFGHIFPTKAHIDNRKKLLNSNTSSTCPHDMVNFGSLTAEICPVVSGTPANFNGFRILAALLHGTPAVSQTLWPSHWASAHILVTDFFLLIFKSYIFCDFHLCIFIML